jgi:hypothetical protein
MRECLRVVVKTQRDMEKCEKEMKEWVKKEIEHHRRYKYMLT